MLACSIDCKGHLPGLHPLTLSYFVTITIGQILYFRFLDDAPLTHHQSLAGGSSHGGDMVQPPNSIQQPPSQLMLQQQSGIPQRGHTPSSSGSWLFSTSSGNGFSSGSPPLPSTFTQFTSPPITTTSAEELHTFDVLKGTTSTSSAASYIVSPVSTTSTSVLNLSDVIVDSSNSGVAAPPQSIFGPHPGTHQQHFHQEQILLPPHHQTAMIATQDQEQPSKLEYHTSHSYQASGTTLQSTYSQLSSTADTGKHSVLKCTVLICFIYHVLYLSQGASRHHHIAVRKNRICLIRLR